MDPRRQQPTGVPGFVGLSRTVCALVGLAAPLGTMGRSRVHGRLYHPTEARAMAGSETSAVLRHIAGRSVPDEYAVVAVAGCGALVGGRGAHDGLACHQPRVCRAGALPAGA